MAKLSKETIEGITRYIAEHELGWEVELYEREGVARIATGYRGMTIRVSRQMILVNRCDPTMVTRAQLSAVPSPPMEIDELGEYLGKLSAAHCFMAMLDGGK
jgi:hypothetical protein